MLTLSEIQVVKDGGSRQMKFTDQEGAIHEFYLHKNRGDESKPAKRRYTGLFKGSMTGTSASSNEPASREHIQQVCDALENLNRLNDTTTYRELKTRWDEVHRRIEAEMNGDLIEKITAIHKELSDFETSEHWRNHVEEAAWLKQAILESTQVDSNIECNQ